MLRNVVAVDVVPVSVEFDCSVCGEPGTLTCSSCKSIKYCSRQCQVTQWPNHKEICKKIKEFKAKTADSALLIDVGVFGQIEPNFHNYHYIMNERFCKYLEIREDLTHWLIMCGVMNKSRLSQELAIEHNMDVLYIMGMPPDIYYTLDLVFITLVDLGRYGNVLELSALHDSCFKSLLEINTANSGVLEGAFNNPPLDPCIYLYIAEVEQLRVFRQVLSYNIILM